jgi:predicted dehydrogenase
MSPLQIFTEARQALINITPAELPEVRAHTKEIEHFVDCIRTGRECIVNARQVLDVQAVLDAIYLSSDTGHEVCLQR